MAAEYVVRMGARIRERRDELGMSQRELAELIPGKADGNQVSKWERGQHRVGDDTLSHIAAALQVDVSYFLSDGPSRSAQTLDDEAPALNRIERKLDLLIDHFGLIDHGEELERELEEAVQPSASRDEDTGRGAPARQRAAR